MFECLATVGSIFSDEPMDEIYDDSFIEHFVDKTECFLDEFPEHGVAKLKAHAACYDGVNHETLSIPKVRTAKIQACAWMLT